MPQRFAGTPQARKAWVILRGPFILAYLIMTILSVVLMPSSLGGMVTAIWVTLLFITGVVLMVGSVASFVVVTRRETGRHWTCLELLEVSGLRALVAIQVIFALVNIVHGEPLVDVLQNILLGAFALGILTNLAWNRGGSAA